LIVVYLSAFVSFFVQIPGLYGADGLEPAETYMANIESAHKEKRLNIVPNIIWFTGSINDALVKFWPAFGSFSHTENMMHIVCLLPKLLHT
jgi:hypothetical protein